MKATEPKSATAAANSMKPFSAKESEAVLHGNTGKERTGFAGASGNTGVLQTKLSVGRPDDHYEKEADHVADKVVSRLSDPAPDVQSKPVGPAAAITPVISNKLSGAGPEDKLNKKEEENQEQEEKVQKKPIFESRADVPDDDKNVQRKTAAAGFLQAKESAAAADTASAGIESSLNASKGSGNPLTPDTRSEMESSFGTDFSSVRIHDDSNAVQMSRELNAQAFTHGNDIYFNSGKYNTDSTAGKHLLAHELTHTVQQSGKVQKMIQKKGESGKIETGTPPKIILPLINLPKAKDRTNNPLLAPPLKRRKGYVRADSYKDVKDVSSSKEQRDIWKLAVKDKTEKNVREKLAVAKSKNAYDKVKDVYYLKFGSLSLVGKEKDIAEMAAIPTWTKSGKASAFDVDHVKELQLGGENHISNMELLNFTINTASGNSIRLEIIEKVEDFIKAENAKATKEAAAAQKAGDIKPAAGNTIPKDAKDAKANYDIEFTGTKFFKKPEAAGKDHFWSFEDIVGGKQIDKFAPMKEDEIESVKGKKGDEKIYTSPVGGTGLSKKDILGFSGPHITFAIDEFPDQTGKQPGDLVHSFKADFAMYGSRQKKKSVVIPVYQMEGVLVGGHIPGHGEKGKGGLRQLLTGLELEGMSPMVVETAELVPGKGFQVKGKIQPTLDFMKGIELDFYIDGDDFGISKTFTSEDLKDKIPKPFKLNSASVTVSAGSKGIKLSGDILFEIERLGTGKISGYGKSDGEFGVNGQFDFDKKLFKGKGKNNAGASIEVDYSNKKGWSAKGTLQIDEGAVKGVKSGTITVGYANNSLEAAGTAEVKIKGIKEVTLRIKFAEGISEIEGGVKIEKLPGIKDGEGTLKIVKTGDEYDFSGSGKITPDIPGVTSQLAFEFHNDIFLVDTKMSFEKGRLKGDLNIGITNRAIDPATGKPTGEALPDYKVYGSSELSLKITNNITVTAGVKLLENGEIEVKGGIKLPPKIEVVPKLFSVTNKPIVEIPEISFPLFGIPLGVTTLGLEATIAPYIKADAQIGPGYLANTQAEVVYNPSHPEDLTITGGADFEFIAEASLHAGVDFGVGISIGIAAAKGGINLDAYIKVAAKQPIFHADIKYTPATGFELNGNIKAIVAAVLGFSGSLFLSLRAGVWPLKKTWRWDKELFKKEVDTGLEIGFEFPFSYKNGEANVSFDNMKFIYPKFDRSFLKTLSDKLIKPVVDDLI